MQNKTHTHQGQSKRAVEFFESKIKDAMLFGDIKRAVASNTDVCFNHLFHGRGRRIVRRTHSLERQDFFPSLSRPLNQRRDTISDNRSVIGMPPTEACRGNGTMKSLRSPSTRALVSSTDTPRSKAIEVRNRDESRMLPCPSSGALGRTSGSHVHHGINRIGDHDEYRL